MARDLPMNYVRIGSLNVAKALHEFIEQEAAAGTSLSAEAFWSGFAELLRDCGTRNRQLLHVRDELQSCIDQYHRERSGEPLDLGDYERFLRDIGYVLPEGNDFAIRTANVDDEIAVMAPACRAALQRAICAECRKRALGQPLRCTLWHGCHPGGRRRRPHRYVQQDTR
jgi:malate synthase